MNRKLTFLVCAVICFSSVLFIQAQENWTHLRGSNLDGHSVSKNAPVSWSETSNIFWKTAIRGVAWSSPVVF